MPKGIGKDDEILDRRQRGFALRVSGYSIREIAKELGISTGLAHKDVVETRKECRRRMQDDVDYEREVSLARLENGIRVVYDVILKPIDSETFPDDAGPADKQAIFEASHELKLKALDRMVKLEERRSKLLGTDAPTTQEIQTTINGAATPEEAARLVRAKFGELASKPLGSAAATAEPAVDSGDSTGSVPDGIAGT